MATAAGWRTHAMKNPHDTAMPGFAPLRAMFAFAVLAVALPIRAHALCVIGEEPLASDRFERFEENFAIWNQMYNNRWAGADDGALRAHYSFKYRVTPDKCLPTVFGRASEVFLSYTGEFDFYLGTRPSGPVINRLSNPALHWHTIETNHIGSKYDFDVGLEHRSDGQVTEVITPAEADRAQRAYDSKDKEFFDTISRGSNYLSFTMLQQDAFGIPKLSFRSRLKLYLTRDSRVTWGPLAGGGSSISRYDLLNLRARYATERFGIVEIDYVVGSNGLAGDSLTVGWFAKPDTALPIYLRVHIGPMNTLSNYSQRQDSIGFGLRFEPK